MGDYPHSKDKVEVSFRDTDGSSHKVNLIGVDVDVPSGTVILRFPEGRLVYRKVISGGDDLVYDGGPSDSSVLEIVNPHSAPARSYVKRSWADATSEHVTQKLTYDRSARKEDDTPQVRALRALDEDRDGVVIASMSYLNFVAGEIERNGHYRKPTEAEIIEAGDY